MHLTLENSAPSRPAYPALANPRYVSLDMWRGLACLMILLLHAGFYAKVDADQSHHSIAGKILALISQLWIGVPMFFVISGYCISATVDSSRRKSHSTADYFKRRLRRIFPPYWVAFILTIIAFWLAATYLPTLHKVIPGRNTLDVQSPSALSPTQWFGNATLTETWRHHILGKAEDELIVPSWTLCYEEQFYVVCGLVLLLMPKRFFTGAMIVSILTAALFVMSIRQPALHLKGFFFDGKWLMFAAGVLVYYYLNYSPIGGKWLIPSMFVVAILGLKVAFAKVGRHSSEEISDQIYWCYVATIFALGITLLRPWDKAIASAKILAPIALCGRMCYSLYLVHWPISKILGAALYHMGVKGDLPVLTITVPVIAAVSLAFAWVFHQFVERHFLNSRRTVQSRPRVEPITGGGAPVLSGVGDAALN